RVARNRSVVAAWRNLLYTRDGTARRRLFTCGQGAADDELVAADVVRGCGCFATGLTPKALGSGRSAIDGGRVARELSASLFSDASDLGLVDAHRPRTRLPSEGGSAGLFTQGIFACDGAA